MASRTAEHGVCAAMPSGNVIVQISRGWSSKPLPGPLCNTEMAVEVLVRRDVPPRGARPPYAPVPPGGGASGNARFARPHTRSALPRYRTQAIRRTNFSGRTPQDFLPKPLLIAAFRLSMMCITGTPSKNSRARCWPSRKHSWAARGYTLTHVALL
jgi:hypothetical protein